MRSPDAADRDARLRAAFEHAPDGMALIDPATGSATAVNPAGCEILGRQEDELLRGAFPLEPGEQRVTRGDGRAIRVEARFSPEGVCQFTDVTARHEAQEDLRQSEQRLRTILQTTNEGVWVLGNDDRTTFMNARMATMLGGSVEDLIGRPITDFLDDEYAQIAQARLAGRRRGVADQFEMRYRTLDGRDLWTIVNATPITDADGNYTGAFAMVTDITERMGHERAIRASEERYRNLIETTTEGVWMIDGEQRTTYVNRRMAEMLGYDVEEMLGRRATDFMGDADADPSGGRPREVRYRRKDGSEMWGLLSGSPLTDGSGGYGGALAMVTDITERKRAEVSLARLAAIVESSPDAIFSTDLEGTITSWNSAAERIYGYSEEEAVGQSAWMIVVPEREDEALALGQSLLEGGSMVDFLSQGRAKDGRIIDIATSVSAIRSPRGDVVGTLAIVRERPPGRA